MAVSLLSVAGPTFAQSQSSQDFYRGKTIRLIIGAAAGGGYDLPGRALANHITRHISGAPKIVVENMPGASSLIMTNYLYNIAPRDGTVIGMVNNSIPLEPRLKVLTRQGGGAQFDLEKMSWIGRSTMPFAVSERFTVSTLTCFMTFLKAVRNRGP